MRTASVLSALAATAAAVDVSIDVGNTLHPANEMYMGCHSDSGFVHVRGAGTVKKTYSIKDSINYVNNNILAQWPFPLGSAPRRWPSRGRS